MKPSFKYRRAHLGIVVLERGRRADVTKCRFVPTEYKLDGDMITIEFDAECKEKLSILPKLRGYYRADVFQGINKSFTLKYLWEGLSYELEGTLRGMIPSQDLVSVISFLESEPMLECFDCVFGECVKINPETVLTLGFGIAGHLVLGTESGEGQGRGTYETREFVGLLISWFLKEDIISYGYSLDRTLGIFVPRIGEIPSFTPTKIKIILEGTGNMSDALRSLPENIVVDQDIVLGRERGSISECWYLGRDKVESAGWATCIRSPENTMASYLAYVLEERYSYYYEAVRHFVFYNGALYNLLRNFDLAVIQKYTKEGCIGLAIVATMPSQSTGYVVLGASEAIKRDIPCIEISTSDVRVGCLGEEVLRLRPSFLSGYPGQEPERPIIG